jgi:predicted enzyme related to lactoylglutathione lyase
VAARTAGFDHVHLHVEDIERALGFYREAFGADEEFRVGDKLVFVRLGGGEIFGLDGRGDAGRNPAHVGLRLAEDESLDTALESIVRAGGSVLERGEHEPGLSYAYIADPDGNVFEV